MRRQALATWGEHLTSACILWAEAPDPIEITQMRLLPHFRVKVRFYGASLYPR